MNDMNFITPGPFGIMGDGIINVLRSDGVVSKIEHVDVKKIEETCPLLAMAFEESRSGQRCDVENSSSEAVAALLRFIYKETGDYTPDDMEDSEISMLFHAQVYRLAETYDYHELQQRAAFYINTSCELACSNPAPPTGICDAIDYLYQHPHLPPPTELVETIAHYCVSCFLYHKLGDDLQFRQLAYDLRQFQKDLCNVNIRRGFVDDAAMAIIQLPIRPYGPTACSALQRRVLGDYLWELWSDVADSKMEGIEMTKTESTVPSERRVHFREGEKANIMREERRLHLPYRGVVDNALRPSSEAHSPPPMQMSDREWVRSLDTLAEAMQSDYTDEKHYFGSRTPRAHIEAPGPVLTVRNHTAADLDDDVPEAHTPVQFGPVQIPNRPNIDTPYFDHYGNRVVHVPRDIVPPYNHTQHQNRSYTLDELREHMEMLYEIEELDAWEEAVRNGSVRGSAEQQKSTNKQAPTESPSFRSKKRYSNDFEEAFNTNRQSKASHPVKQTSSSRDTPVQRIKLFYDQYMSEFAWASEKQLEKANARFADAIERNSDDSVINGTFNKPAKPAKSSEEEYLTLAIKSILEGTDRTTEMLRFLVTATTGRRKAKMRDAGTSPLLSSTVVNDGMEMKAKELKEEVVVEDDGFVHVGDSSESEWDMV